MAKDLGDLKAKASKLGRKSKSKGSRFELEIAKVLDDWFYAEEKAKIGLERVLRRTPLSGGWCKTGDIQIDPRVEKEAGLPPYPFHTELKKREGWNLEQILLNEKCPIIHEWWKQCTDEAREGAIPLLIFARNMVDPLCLLRLGSLSPFLGVLSENPIIIYNSFLLKGELVLLPLWEFLKFDAALFKKTITGQATFGAGKLG